MNLVDNSTGGTIYAWGTVAGTAMPVCQSLEWTTQVQMTQMPIPLQDDPLLLNFGGAQPSLTITWLISTSANFTGTPAGDWNSLMGQSWGSNTSGYTLNVPEIGTLSVSGFIYQIQMTYTGGQENTYTASLTMYLGTVV
jgi:hypothetical protein